MAENPWGRPAVKTFRKRNIRQVKSATTSVLVHQDIADIVAEVLRLVEATGYKFMVGQTGGWVPYTGAPGHLHTYREYGLALEVPPHAINPPPGFAWAGDDVPGWMIYVGTPEEARAHSAATEEERVVRLTPQLPKDADAWQTCGPGCRTLKEGDKGDDVQFVQFALGTVTHDGVYDRYTADAVRALQSRFNQEQTGILDDSTWKALLPTTSNFMLDYGDVGPMVRVLQAALLAYDWEPEVYVTGRFDQVTLGGVKHLQDTFGLRTTGTMRGPEWAALLGRPVRDVG
jgi:hypothetical protein